MVPDNIDDSFKRTLLKKRVENELVHVKASCIDVDKTRDADKGFIKYVYDVDLPLLDGFKQEMHVPVSHREEITEEDYDDEAEKMLCSVLTRKLFEQGLDWDSVLAEMWPD